MSGIEQRPVGTVVDVEFVAAAALHFHDHRGVFRAQCAARLAPQFGVVGDRQRFEVAMDDREIVFERRWLHARIDAREAAADIDHVDHDAGLGHRQRARAPGPGYRQTASSPGCRRGNRCPSQSATWRVACSSGAASARSMPNLEARLSSEYSEDTRRRTSRRRSCAGLPSLSAVASTIFSSSSSCIEAEGASRHACDRPRVSRSASSPDA